MTSQSHDDDPLPRLPPRRIDSHKGDYGRALLIGGSRGMSGAIALAGMACLRSGAGLVRLAVPAECLTTVAAFEPCYMTEPLDCCARGLLAITAGMRMFELTTQATAVACGPGLGRSDDISKLVGQLYRDLTLPLVVDADALNALGERPSMLHQHAGPRILTPHPGEFARLVGSGNVPTKYREEAAAKLSVQAQAVVVLKGHATVVADGKRTSVNRTGNPGMATGGTGDVLTGIIVALLCQGLDAFAAARLGTHVHGLAGDLAARDKGHLGLIARDLVEYLPLAWQSL